MLRDLLPRLRCPVCRAASLGLSVFEAGDDGDAREGAAVCAGCGEWFPVEGGVLDLLVSELAYADDRASFRSRHGRRLGALGVGGGATAGGGAGLQRRQQEHFDWYASNDTQTYGSYERQPFWVAADRLAFRPWRRRVPPGSWLLDAGCAQGRSAFRFMDLPIRVAAFDVSKALVRQAAERYRAGRWRARAAFFCADADAFPVADAAFDRVLLYGVLHHVPSPEATCREVARVLKPGGVYFGQENNRTAFRAAFDRLQGWRPAWHEEAGPNALMSAREVEQWFAGTGVEVATATSVYLPPHLLNRLPAGAAYRLLRAADRLGGAFPWLRDQGGVLLITATKRGAASCVSR